MKSVVCFTFCILYLIVEPNLSQELVPSVFQASYDVRHVSASVPLSVRIRCGNAGLGSGYAAVEIASNCSCIAYTAEEMSSLPLDADVLHKIGDVQTFSPTYVLPAGSLYGPMCPRHVKCGSTVAVEVDLLESSTTLTLLLHEGVSLPDMYNFSLRHPYSAKVHRSTGKITATSYDGNGNLSPEMTYVWSPPLGITVRFQIHVQSKGAEMTVTSKEGTSRFEYPGPIECEKINWFLIGHNDVDMPVHMFSYDSPYNYM